MRVIGQGDPIPSTTQPITSPGPSQAAGFIRHLADCALCEHYHLRRRREPAPIHRTDSAQRFSCI